MIRHHKDIAENIVVIKIKLRTCAACILILHRILDTRNVISIRHCAVLAFRGDNIRYQIGIVSGKNVITSGLFQHHCFGCGVDGGHFISFFRLSIEREKIVFNRVFAILIFARRQLRTGDGIYRSFQITDINPAHTAVNSGFVIDGRHSPRRRVQVEKSPQSGDFVTGGNDGGAFANLPVKFRQFYISHLLTLLVDGEIFLFVVSCQRVFAVKRRRHGILTVYDDITVFIDIADETVFIRNGHKSVAKENIGARIGAACQQAARQRRHKHDCKNHQ